MIDPERLARRLAGHANAARGDWILWIFGVDEKSGFVGVPSFDWADLWPNVQSHFDANAPRPVIVSIESECGSVVAVAFETTLPPYVIRNPAFGQSAAGPCEREVPWREGTRVRSAKHSDLLLLLTSRSSVPEVEITETEVHLSGGSRHAELAHYLLQANLYFMPKSENRVVIPLHRIQRSWRLNGSEWPHNAADEFSFDLVKRKEASTPAVCDGVQIILDGPAMIRLTTFLSLPSNFASQTQQLTLRLQCRVNFESLPLDVSIEFGSRH